jgi:4-amino-4-deoxychorismate lyase
MYPLFESIKVVEGQFLNLDWHQRRVDQSCAKIFKTTSKFSLGDGLVVPSEYRQGVVKCRVSYGEHLGPSQFAEYSRKDIKKLQQVECNAFNYSLKYQDRSRLEQLYALRGICDEVLITHGGYISDTSYSNVVLFDGSNWITPDTPLLEGTQRARLLYGGLLTTGKIHITDLSAFEKLVLINAMIEFDPDDYIAITDISLWNHRQVVV